MHHSIINLDARFSILSLKRLPYYAFYFEGKPCSVHASREEATKAAVKFALEIK